MSATIAEKVEVCEAFPDDLEALEVSELGGFGADRMPVYLSQLSSSARGVRFEMNGAVRTLTPRKARRIARELIRGAAFAELRGCDPDMPWVREVKG